MKIAIVNLSLLRREGTWAAEHYLGDEDKLQMEVARRKEEIEKKQEKLRKLEARVVSERARIVRLQKELKALR
jgi:cell division protein FtsB